MDPRDTQDYAATARLGGTGLLADDLWLMAHDDVTGRCFLQPRAMGLGLAGGLLAELMLAGAISTRHGRVVVTGPASPGGQLGQAVAGLVAAEREPRPVPDWLAFVARTALTDVAVRLEAAGYLTKVTSRRPWRGERWVPVDADCAFAPLGRARPALGATRPVTVYNAVLAGLAVACGLGPRLLPYGPPDSRHRLRLWLDQLPPDLRELIAHTQSAVDSAVLSHRL